MDFRIVLNLPNNSAHCCEIDKKKNEFNSDRTVGTKVNQEAMHKVLA